MALMKQLRHQGQQLWFSQSFLGLCVSAFQAGASKEESHLSHVPLLLGNKIVLSDFLCGLWERSMSPGFPLLWESLRK